MKFNSIDQSLALKLDQEDPLKNFRSKFVSSNPNEIYLNGNSLGPLPIKTKERLESAIENEWGQRLVRGWKEGWFELAENVGKKISKIIGAKPDEVLTADSTSINLYKLVHAALKYQKGKTKIVSDALNFPSDLYVLQGIMNQLNNNHTLELVKSRDNISIDVEDMAQAIDDNTALVTLSHVCFRSGYLYDLQKITKIAHEKGALVLWDLSHSAGVVDVDLNQAGVDLAIGCTYKYINGGPGSPAFLFIRNDLISKIEMPIWGWFGEENPFNFQLDFQPSKGIKKFQVSTPAILSLTAVDSSLDLILEAGIKQIREKSVLQTEYLIYLAENILQPLGFTINSPRNSTNRGSHVALVNKDAYSISHAIKYNKENAAVIFDFRKPGVMRLSTSPLYNTYDELWRAVKEIENLVSTGKFENKEEIEGVT